MLLYKHSDLRKTFITEILTEYLQHSLYKISTDELIENRCLKNSVFNIFKTASHFNTILLMNKADVFLHECSVSEVHNHSVTVFLHKLEYFEEVLFLTTNHVNEFDDAILSRIHYKLKYEALSWEFWRDVWRSFLSKSCMHKRSPQLSSDELHKLKGLDLSAREVYGRTLTIHISSLTVYSSSDQKPGYDRPCTCHCQ
ncbi:hypothetical protein, variant [Blastomyces dermatitidis ATCC 26199]|nr:hypothetical protein, variant [Blastomyces dermatitidis ATCC 26199]